MDAKQVQNLVDTAISAAVANVRAEFNANSASKVNSVSTASTVDVVAVKVASFNPDFPEIWFLQLEDQFKLRGIKTQDTMYEYVTSNMDRKTSGEMAGFLMNRPSSDAYAKIRAEMIRRYGKTQLQKDNSLLAMTGLGDRTPSEAWQHVKSLNKDPSSFMRAWFLNLIPAKTRALLGKAASQGTVEEMCEEADVIMEQLNQTAGVASISAAAKAHLQDGEGDQELEVDAVGRGQPRRPKGGRPSQPPGSGGRSFVCMPHTKFGPKAYTCREGCSFNGLPLAARPATAPASAAGNFNAGR